MVSCLSPPGNMLCWPRGLCWMFLFPHRENGVVGDGTSLASLPRSTVECLLICRFACTSNTAYTGLCDVLAPKSYRAGDAPPLGRQFNPALHLELIRITTQGSDLREGGTVSSRCASRSRLGTPLPPPGVRGSTWVKGFAQCKMTP